MVDCFLVFFLFGFGFLVVFCFTAFFKLDFCLYKTVKLTGKHLNILGISPSQVTAIDFQRFLTDKHPKV